MPVDTSFYNSAPPKPVNPLEMMSQIQGIQGQQLRNQLMQRTMAGQQAFGSAAQAAMRSDGTIDAAKFQSGFQNNPDGAYAGDAAAQFGLSQQQGATALSTAHIQNAGMQLDRMNNVFSGMLTQAVGPDGKLDPTKLTDTLMDQGFNQAAEAGLDPKTLASEKMSMPTDPGMRAQWLLGHISQNADAISKFKAAYGDNTQTNDGATINSARTSIAQGGTLPSYAMQTTPEFKATPQQGPVDSMGRPTTEMPAQRSQQGQIPITQGPAQIAAQSTGGTLGAQAEAAFSQQRSQASQNEATFSLLQSEIPKAFTGAGAEQQTSWARIGQKLGLPVSSDTVAASESVAKALAKIINAQPNAGQSDKQLASQISANPHPGLSQEGMTQMVAIAKGNNAQLEAVGNAWDKIKAKGVGSERFNEAQPLLNQRMPTTAFQYMALPNNMKHVLTDSMSKSEYNDLMHTIQIGQKAGWLK